LEGLREIGSYLWGRTGLCAAAAAAVKSVEENDWFPSTWSVKIIYFDLNCKGVYWEYNIEKTEKTCTRGELNSGHKDSQIDGDLRRDQQAERVVYARPCGVLWVQVTEYKPFVFQNIYERRLWLCYMELSCRSSQLPRRPTGGQYMRVSGLSLRCLTFFILLIHDQIDFVVALS
jgi:hypothetical protein